MKKESRYYQIIPTVVPADTKSTVEIRCFEKYYGFTDGVEYEVIFYPCSVPAKPFTEKYLLREAVKAADRCRVTAQNGVLKVSHYFAGEQRWKLHVHAVERSYDNTLYDAYAVPWVSHLDASKNGCMLEMYSVADDLMRLRPYKGDLHVHTVFSDGIETPGTTAANYRMAGFDFVALTDHHIYTAAAAARAALEGLETGLVLLNGEEIHNDYVGQIHMVCVDGDSSINDRILNDRQTVLSEVAAIRDALPVDVDDPVDLSWRIWVYRQIKAVNGIGIFPHPYWSIPVSHASPACIQYVFEHRLLDVFEVYGGCTPSENDLQAALYQQMRVAGYDVPVVGSSDSHSSLNVGESHFGDACTIAFATGAAAVRAALEQGLTVAVQCEKEHRFHVTGDLRLAQYASFLLENYYPLHDELCGAAGLMMHRYVQGRICTAVQDDMQDAANACRLIEKRIARLEKEFFAVPHATQP